MDRPTIRPATPADTGLILEFIRELADYERLAHEVTATEENLRETLFGERPAAEVLLAFAGQTPARLSSASRPGRAPALYEGRQRLDRVHEVVS